MTDVLFGCYLWHSTQAERKRKDEQVRETIMQRLVESGEKER